jgi:hypothetical protein
MAHVMPRYYLYKNFLLLFVYRYYDTIANRGAMSGGAEPLERQVILNDFSRAKKSIFPFIV